MNKDLKPINNNGKPHGIWKMYNKDGQLAFKCNYINGVQVGLSKYYDDNGKLAFKCYYINGVKYLYIKPINKNFISN